MFRLFDKKRPNDLANVAVSANNVACDFSDLIASDRIQDGMIYDVSHLPDAKALIEKSCKIWISLCTDEAERQAWKVVLPMLSQFQEGIGPSPIGLDVTAIAGMEPQEMLKLIRSMKKPSPELLMKVQTEEKALLEWVMHTVDPRS
jgi:hypothetical protein